MKNPVQLFKQLVTFGGAGTIGFLIDTVVFTLVDALIGNPYISRIISYLFAATGTWFLNRRFTFAASGLSIWREWSSFLVLQSGGGIVNYAVFAWLITMFGFFASYPVAAIAAGSIAGMGVNFATAKFLIFERNENKTDTDRKSG